MAADGQVVFEITADGKHVKASIKDITKAIESESKKWDKSAEESTSGIEKAFSDMTKKIVASLSVAKIGAMILDWGRDALEAASDLAEVQNVVDTVFGDGANQIEAWAKKAGTQFGLTETQAKKFTSTLGAMMKSSGLAGSEIVDMSTDLAGLAADMASFYNMDFETSFEKIRSGISGETMPLKQLGINMSVANLEAFALAQGLDKTFSEMSQGEQTMLRYQYLMQATSDAQGDFAKTADGFANAQRRIETALSTISTVAGTFLLNTIEPLVSGVANFLEKITTTPERTVLDDFNEIQIDTTEKLAKLDETYGRAEDLIKVLQSIEAETITLQNGESVTLTSLFGDLAEIEKSGGDISSYIQGLGLDVDYVTLKYNEWKEATRQLTGLVPSLTSVINSETYAIDGGTEALQKNLDEWKANEEKKLAWAAYYAQARALEEKKASYYKFELDTITAESALERLQKKMSDFSEDVAKSALSKSINADINSVTARYTAEEQEYIDTAAKVIEAEGNLEKARKDQEEQAEALAAAEQYVIDAHDGLIKKYGEEEQAAKDAGDAGKEFGEKTDEGWKQATSGAADALKALADYVQGMHDSTEQSVNSVLKGFAKITMPMDELTKKSNELATEETKALNKYSEVWKKWGSSNEALKTMKEYVENGGKLTDTEREAYDALVKVRNAQNELNESMDQYSASGMQKSLESQIKFIDDYLENLKKAEEMGLSGELLASLSDGSVESAQFLSGLVADEEGAKKVEELFSQLQEKKKGFTDALTEEKLAVDETYQGMVDTAIEAVGELDLGDEAKESMASTIQGLASGISENEGAVKAAVDLIIAQLDRLNGLGLNFDLGPLGEISFGFHLDGSNEKGLDYVPFDGYLSELHEGEGILTAEENRIWQRFKNGQSSSPGVDYDALGGVMRDNVKAGGDVYLEGRVVGQVVSGIQGRSYRNLQRSGWQG